jgi:hypothetical protein
MIFALLFIFIFLVGFGIYAFSRSWRLATLVPSLLYIASVVTDRTEGANIMMSIIFGLPIVFVAALLGCYIFVLRFVGIEPVEEATGSNADQTSPDKQDTTTNDDNQLRP